MTFGKCNQTLHRHGRFRRLLSALTLFLLGVAFVYVQRSPNATPEPLSSLLADMGELTNTNVQERYSDTNINKIKKKKEKKRKTNVLPSSREAVPEVEIGERMGGADGLELKASELRAFLSSKCFRNSSAKKHAHNVVNILDGKEYQQHRVMLELHLDEYPLTAGYITEVNGLEVPAEYDCDNLNGLKHWGAFPYFYEVPSRWHACWSHYAAILHRDRIVKPTLDYVDDEYIEQVSVYHSVLRAKARGTYAIAELGARWGTWGSRAIALWKRLMPGVPYSLHFVEADKTHCSGIHRVMKKNNISFSLSCDFATEADIRAWAHDLPLVDLIDFDIQKAEGDLVPKIMDLLNQKTLRVICGTHSQSIHESLLSLFQKEGWREIWSVRPQNKQCSGHVMWCLRRMYRTWRISNCDWNALVGSRCWHETPYGPVAHWDGQLIFDNPVLGVDEDSHGLLSFKEQ